jgi:hypothetical protein
MDVGKKEVFLIFVVLGLLLSSTFLLVGCSSNDKIDWCNEKKYQKESDEYPFFLIDGEKVTSHDYSKAETSLITIGSSIGAAASGFANAPLFGFLGLLRLSETTIHSGSWICIKDGMLSCYVREKGPPYNYAYKESCTEEEYKQFMQDYVSASGIDFNIDFDLQEIEEDEDIPENEKELFKKADELRRDLPTSVGVDISSLIYNDGYGKFIGAKCTKDLENYHHVLTYEDEEGNKNKQLFICHNETWIIYEPDNLPISLDIDGDDIPIWFDCNDSDPTVYGNLYHYSSNAPKPIVTCGDGKDNTCGYIENEVDDCNNNEYACNNNCVISGRECDWVPSSGYSNIGYCCGDKGQEDLGLLGGENKEYLCTNDLSLTPSSISFSKNWQWLSASEQNNNIFTIINFGNNYHDYYSTGDQWIKCSEETIGVLDNIIIDKEKHNKFYCYQEGNNWVWAECCESTFLDDERYCLSNIPLKQRVAGDGLFKLATIVEDNTINFEDYKKHYNVIGNHKEYIDFKEYDYFEFYVFNHEEKQILPQTYKVNFIGHDNQIREKHIFSYVVNNVDLGRGESFHIKIPIDDWLNIKTIVFNNPADLEIKYVQLTKENFAPVCSGIKSAETSPWLESIDFWNIYQDGQNICEAYGLGWIGREADDAGVFNSLCCGNTLNEYFAGEDVACWNSVFLDEEKPVTNVELELTYQETGFNYSYPKQEVIVTLMMEYNLEGDFEKYLEGNVEDLTEDTISFFDELMEEIKEFNKSESNKVIINKEKQKIYVKLIEKDSISYDQGFKEIGVLTFLDNDNVKIINVTNGEAILYHPLSGHYFEKGESIKPYSGVPFFYNQFKLLARTDKTELEFDHKNITEELSFVCYDDICQYPLKGAPPYTIENLHPERYDLYFITSDKGKDETIIFIDKPTTIYTRGWVLVNNADKDVLFQDGEFLSCGSNYELAEEAKMCLIGGDYYCSPLSGWKDDDLKKLIYEEDPVRLTETSEIIPPSYRNYTSSVIYGRNLLYNPIMERIDLPFDRDPIESLRKVTEKSSEPEEESSEESTPEPEQEEEE